jgi:hypothetical protein
MSYTLKTNLALALVMILALAVSAALFFAAPVLLIDGAYYVSGEFLLLSYPVASEGLLPLIGMGTTVIGLALAAGGAALIGKYVE